LGIFDKQMDISRILTLVIFLFVGVPLASGDGKPKTEQITGVVVAYDEIQANWIPCSNNCDGSLIVRVDTAYSSPRYIRVDLTYRSGKFPKKLVQTNAHWRFLLIRTPARDEPLYQFVIKAAAYTPEKRYPIWRLIATGEKLPFEEMISTYSLVGDRFKQVRP